jgi:hypothetical protein
MSGGTGAGYRVETAAERRLRAQRAALAGYAATEAELTGLRAEADAYRSVYGKAIQRVPAARRLRADPDPADIQAANAALVELVHHHRARLQAAVTAAARETIAGLLSAPPAAAPATAPVPAAAAAAAPAEPPGQWRTALAQRAAELVARLPGDTDEQTRRRCDRAAVEATAAASEQRARLLLGDLAERVRVETRRAERVRQAQAELARLDAGLSTVLNGEAAPLRQRVRQLALNRAGQLPDGLSDEVDRLLAQTDRRRHRRTAAAALALGLVELGYEVAEGFETALAVGGDAVAALPHATGYGLRVLLDRDRAVLRTQVVRAASVPGDPEQDAAAEQSFCEDYPALLARLARQGVGTDQLGIYPPGTVPVAAVTDAQLPATAGAARSMPRAKERDL